ncbi:hypothetical protein [Dasania marina]|uniref:hypothetical protein n=1 Tax=Dasania marina TaxID=471499 RepID=UPI0030DB4617|tara:strand:+ start:56474 stop:56686 length:213 start_codon:yes stop_codon:yes gene_type:complete
MISVFKSGHKRTMFLAILATLTFVGAAIFMFDVDKKELLEFFVVSVFGLGIVILAALGLTAIRILIRRFF